MIGGKVIQVRDLTDSTEVWVMDKSGDECAIRVELGHEIACGDTVWWQSKLAFWTCSHGRFEDREMNRLSHSYDPHKVMAPERRYRSDGEIG